MSYGVHIRRLDLSAVFDLQGPEKQIAERLGGIGMVLPKAPNTASRANGLELYWIGRAQWLLRAEISREDEIADRLQPDGGSADISMVPVADGYAFFKISGPDAHHILAIASPLDTAAASFPENGATFTEAFGLKALAIRRETGFELGFDRSYADMVADCLDRATGA